MPKAAKTTMYPMRLAKRPASYLLLVTTLIACAACSAKSVPVHIEFSASWAGQPVQCAERADLIEFLSSLTDNSVLTNERWTDPFER